MQKRHAEIAGGGIAGLAAAAALAQRGWSVRVHERYPSLRVEGFGINLHPNGLRALKALDALHAAIRGGYQVHRRFNQDGQGNVKSSHRRFGTTFIVARRNLVHALAEQAERAGAEIVFNSVCAGATPEGELVLKDGTRHGADLVVAADGVESPLRASLGIAYEHTLFGEGACRFLLPRLEDDFPPGSEGTTSECWSGDRRVVFGACSDEEITMSLSCQEKDTVGRQVPMNFESWGKDFPALRKFFERARAIDWSAVRWAQYQAVRFTPWYRGRVALVGDSAFAMPPNMGQGGCCAMMSALGLARALERDGDLQTALSNWDSELRPIIERAQRWSIGYGHLTRMPNFLRHSALWLINHNPQLRARYRSIPTYEQAGTVALTAEDLRS